MCHHILFGNLAESSAALLQKRNTSPYHLLSVSELLGCEAASRSILDWRIPKRWTMRSCVSALSVLWLKEQLNNTWRNKVAEPN